MPTLDKQPGGSVKADQIKIVTTDGDKIFNSNVALNSSGSVEVQDEGVSLTTAVTKFNFVGAGATVTEPVTNEMLVTITDTVYSHPNHTGDVTSTGDGATVIGAKKVTLGMLADGIDGELITYDASGVAAKVSAGTAAQVLTSNGVGAAPTFQASAGSTSGTWTPVISDGTNNATMGATNYGGYIKIGDYVWLMANVITTSLGSVSGNLRITGLPFEVTHTADASGSVYFSTCQGMAFASTAYHPYGELASTQDWISLLLQDTTAGTSAMQATEWSANGRGVLHGMYLAA